MPRNEQVRIMGVGTSGSGISSTGNTILKEVKFLSKRSGSSITKSRQIGTVTWEKSLFDNIQGSSKENIDVLFFDNPGFNCTDLSNKEIMTILKQTAYETNPRPHAILYVMRIGRLPPEEVNSIEMFVETFGKGAMPYVMLVFTHKDNMDFDTLDQYISEMPQPFQTFCSECGLGHIAINNSTDISERTKQALFILQKIYKPSVLMNTLVLPVESLQLTTNEYNEGIWNRIYKVIPKHIREQGGIYITVTGFIVALYFGEQTVSKLFEIIGRWFISHLP